MARARCSARRKPVPGHSSFRIAVGCSMKVRWSGKPATRVVVALEVWSAPSDLDDGQAGIGWVQAHPSVRGCVHCRPDEPAGR